MDEGGEERGLRIGTFAGAPVVIEPTFLLVALYIIGSDLLRGEAITGSLIFVGVLMAAVLLHEFGHAAAAAALKIQSRRIVLTFFGGYVQFVNPPQKRWHEIFVSFAGPATNLISWFVASVLLGFSSIDLVYGAGGNSLWYDAVLQFGWVSLVLGLFNLIPAFPLDGGHILRAFLNYFVRRARAGNIAAWCGLVFAVGFAAFALSQSMLWSAAIAGLLGLSAWAEIVRTQRLLKGQSPDSTISNA